MLEGGGLVWPISLEYTLSVLGNFMFNITPIWMYGVCTELDNWVVYDFLLSLTL